MRKVTRSRRARGAAAVELALSMIVFIPVFMYAIFLDDLLRYSLDVQEATVSTVWDFTVQDYTKPLRKESTVADHPGGLSAVQKYARLMYCDHESGKNDYEGMITGSDGNMTYTDCEGTDHHKALVAHVCWINPKAQQVTCDEPDSSAGSISTDPLYGRYQNSFTNGGLIRCVAKAVVENYLLPEEFLPEFSKKKLTRENWKDKGGNVHSNAKEGDSSNAYYIKEQKLAIITDTWALTRDAKIEPGTKSGEFYDRVANVYQNPANGGYTNVVSKSTDFLTSATEELLSSAVMADGILGDLPARPNVAISPQTGGEPTQEISQEMSKKKYFNTEWKDWDKNTNEKTYNARGNWYLGCKQDQKC